MAAAFLIGYGAFRFIAEYFREPDAFLGILSLGMSMGEWLCVPMILSGIAVMEAVIGVPITEWMDAQVFAPLGMRDSSLVWKRAYEGRAVHANGAASSGMRWRVPVAAASLYTTAGDYARLLSAWVADAPLLALALSAPVAADKSLGLEWAYGWGMERTPAGPMLWQWGNNPGFRNFAMVSPASGDGFVLLTNSDRGMALAMPLAQQVLPGGHPAFRSPLLG